MAHQLILSLKQKQNPRGILMKVMRDDSLSHGHTFHFKKKYIVCSLHKTIMNLEQNSWNM